MKSVAIHELKAHCSSIVNEIASKLEPVMITRHGKPVAQIVPIDRKLPDDKNILIGSVIEYGDIESPIDTDWKADKD